MKVSLGKVRPEHVKKVARELIERYPDKFTTEFQSNKKALDSVAQVYSPRLKNRVAGYITRLLAIAKRKAQFESDGEEGLEETVDDGEEDEE
jgi:small subunit ribosomal protein S17e